MASVFAGTGSHASPQAFIDRFVPAVTVGAVVVLAGAALALVLPARGSAAHGAGQPAVVPAAA